MPKSSSYRSSKSPSLTNASPDHDQEPFFSSPKESTFFQPKLSIGEPGDKFEKEADNVADKVISKKDGDEEPAIQRQEISTIQRQEISTIQRQEISTIQRLATPLEDEHFATNDERMKRDRELREKPEVQLKCSHCEASAPGRTASSSLTSRIDSSRGKGSPMPASTLGEMQTAFGQDFSRVNIHTDASSVEMNRELGAQAFTHGSDIYFNTGKFNPDSSTGKHLLAHELTHVVQQNPSPTPAATHSAAPVQRQPHKDIPEANNQFYGHGAFMGAAPQLMADPKWNRILKALMPDVHAAAAKALSKGPDSPTLILQFENNPVMAAYGMYKTKALDQSAHNGRADRIGKMEAMEWDVFLPDAIVAAFNKTGDPREKDRLAHEMVNEMIIAHGTFTQTVRENGPKGGLRQYDNVKETDKSDQGGVRPGAWMDLFGRAMQLGTDPDWETRIKEYEDNLHPRVDSRSDKAADKTFKNQMPFRDIVNVYKQYFGKDRFSVLLDIKSRDASPAVLGALVAELNKRGVFVYGVGTFTHQEIEGLAKKEQTIDGQKFSGPTEVKFFHYAGDLQTACLDKKIKQGDTVMFNAGSLIDYKRSKFGKVKKESYTIKADVVNQLQQYKQYYGFHLGVYVQENDIDDNAARLLTELTNSRPDIFDLGFSWGGISGQTASDIEPGVRAKVGTHLQSLAGNHWDTGKQGPAMSWAKSREVPLISERTYAMASELIAAGNFHGALDIVMNDLIISGTVNPTLFSYEAVPHLKDGDKGQTALNNLERVPGTDFLLPMARSRVRLASNAFTSVRALTGSIMLQYQFVRQQMLNVHKMEELGAKRDEYREASQVEAYLWALEHLAETGLASDRHAIEELYRGLTKYYNLLGQDNPSRQQQYSKRYEAATRLAHPKTK